MTINQGPSGSGNAMMDKLKDILLKEDREQLLQLQSTLEKPEELSKYVNPIIEEHLEFLKENFPNEYKQVVIQLIDKRLQQSQDEILTLLAPKVGKMVRKYIEHQFQALREQIERQIRQNFFSRWLARLRGVSQADYIINQVNPNPLKVEEAYVIQRDSGLLIGSATHSNAIDKDVIAGMLTAIKAFVEDAFKKENSDLEMIKYDSYTLMMQDFVGYYIALAISGTPTSQEQQEIMNRMNDFAEQELSRKIDIESVSLHLEMKESLEKYFMA